MNRFGSGALVVSVALLAASCSRKSESAALKPTAFGVAIVESSGGSSSVRRELLCLSRS